MGFIGFHITLITVKQIIGRAFRDPNDFVRIYLCDSRYKEYFSDLGLKEKEIKLFVLNNNEALYDYRNSSKIYRR